ncbi:MAG: hypothetical protein QME94_06785 [Anaerolineae bacterium]|nr:hypothetical protein [Anaerolineae bacterium]
MRGIYRSSGEYALGGGFWGGGQATLAGHRIYLPLVLRDHRQQ